MKFIHFTDLHLVAGGALLWGLDPVRSLDACLADIAAHHKDAAFCAISVELAERGETMVSETIAWTKLVGQPFTFRAASEVHLQPGQKVAIGFDPSRGSVFDAESGERI